MTKNYIFKTIIAVCIFMEWAALFVFWIFGYSSYDSFVHENGDRSLWVKYSSVSIFAASVSFLFFKATRVFRHVLKNKNGEAS